MPKQGKTVALQGNTGAAYRTVVLINLASSALSDVKHPRCKLPPAAQILAK
jgi:hypothetical protein